MSNLLVYFSGTGNSLRIAQDVAAGLGECELIHVKNAIDSHIPNTYERIGLCFPVYAWGAPQIVNKFVNSLSKNFITTYFFAIVTFKNEPGAVLNELSKRLLRKELDLKAGFYVSMPGNHIVHYELEGPERQKRKFDEWQGRCHDIIYTVHHKMCNEYTTTSIIDRFLKSGLLYRVASKQFRTFSSGFNVNDHCNGCGTCESVCSVKNIEMRNRHPTWRNHCEECLACMHWCPKLAIEYKDKTKGKLRYHHPDVSLKEIIV